MTVTKLVLNEKKTYSCPKCNRELRYVEGGAVSVVNGRVDMSTTLPKYECDHCGVYYQELLGSGYYDEFPLAKPKYVKRIIATGDIPPTQLKREADGKCECPRCGERMNFVEGQPVRIVNGKPDMDNVMDHFECPYCDSVYRRIASTDYFQWSEK
ncbi:MAG: hypothetical protein IJR38_01690 [Selenomonadaceae bacterium]|nr:hypothetical protein [Selenomonadaceae bacterium]